MVTPQEIAEKVQMTVEEVRAILNEKPGYVASEATKDVVFGAARELGYDLKKLKIGKRLEIRRNTIAEIMTVVEENESWSRDDIIEHLKESLNLVKRVQKRTFPHEFPDK